MPLPCHNAMSDKLIFGNDRRHELDLLQNVTESIGMNISS